MEVPGNLKILYSHWNLHTVHEKSIVSIENSLDFKNDPLLKDIRDFVSERISIWQKKTAGELPPFTTDPILSAYRFCNIFREFDRQTIEFHELLNPLRGDFALWLLNMFYFRMVARTETVRQLGFLSFDEKQNGKLYERFLNLSRPKFGTPYVFPISVIQKSRTPTREMFITQYLPSVMKEVAAEIESWKKESVFGGIKKIIPIFGFNLNFLWTEVLIDVAYQFPEYIDLFGRFPVGPGSLPTMNRIDRMKDPTILVTELALLPVDTGVTFNGVRLRLSAENWEGIGCEYRKYTNLKSGKGRKRIFKNNHNDS